MTSIPRRRCRRARRRSRCRVRGRRRATASLRRSPLRRRCTPGGGPRRRGGRYSRRGRRRRARRRSRSQALGGRREPCACASSSSRRGGRARGRPSACLAGDGAALDHAQRPRCSGRVRVPARTRSHSSRRRRGSFEVVDPRASEVRRTNRLDEPVKPVSEAGEHRAEAFVLSGGNACTCVGYQPMGQMGVEWARSRG